MLDYTLQNAIYELTAAEANLLENNPPTSKDDWSHSRYNDYKQNLKTHLILHQLDRCAYCRKRLESDGKYEPLEHIVAKASKFGWIFLVKNLIVTCDSCNNLKNDEDILTAPYEDAQDLPDVSEAYKIFNPYFENWLSQLTYEDDIFITPVPNTKGKATIKICKLYRYNVLLNRAKELKLGQKAPSKRVLHKLNMLKPDDHESWQLREQFQSALNHFVERMNDDPRFD